MAEKRPFGQKNQPDQFTGVDCKWFAIANKRLHELKDQNVWDAWMNGAPLHLPFTPKASITIISCVRKDLDVVHVGSLRINIETKTCRFNTAQISGVNHDLYLLESPQHKTDNDKATRRGIEEWQIREIPADMDRQLAIWLDCWPERFSTHEIGTPLITQLRNRCTPEMAVFAHTGMERKV